MQTLITTTHVEGFRPEWLDGALFLTVKQGRVEAQDARTNGHEVLSV
jgi:recombinational DNA repair ATPase RecF